MKDDKKEFPWELLPWSLDNNIYYYYCLWIDRSESSPTLHLSNQMDCAETISFQPDDLADLDEFIGRLQEARKWLAEEAARIA